MKNSEFRNFLKEVCANHGITFTVLGQLTNLSTPYFSQIGINKKIAYNKLLDILKVIPATEYEIKHLKFLCDYTTPDDPFILDTGFLEAVDYRLRMQEANWQNPQEVVKAVLHFAGVKTIVIE